MIKARTEGIVRALCILRTQDSMLCFRHCCAILFLDVISRASVRNKRDEEVDLKKASYKKLWKLLIDKDLNKKTLAQVANISQSTLTKMSKGESVNVEMLERICNALDCDFHDIMEMVSESNTEE